jgi:hypothetical protein
MAYATTHTSGIPLFGLIGRFFSAIGNGLVRIAEANSKVKQAEALNALTDAQLAERGMKRQDIARAVFMDNYWV